MRILWEEGKEGATSHPLDREQPSTQSKAVWRVASSGRVHKRIIGEAQTGNLAQQGRQGRPSWAVMSSTKKRVEKSGKSRNPGIIKPSGISNLGLSLPLSFSLHTVMYEKRLHFLAKTIPTRCHRAYPPVVFRPPALLHQPID
jgi:hypothetical protein